jgi:hypothetical protein
MNNDLSPKLAAAMGMEPPAPSKHKPNEEFAQPVDPKFQQSWDRALKLQQELPECLRNGMGGFCG